MYRRAGTSFRFSRVIVKSRFSGSLCLIFNTQEIGNFLGLPLQRRRNLFTILYATPCFEKSGLGGPNNLTRLCH
jgi:hypothetical protein